MDSRFPVQNGGSKRYIVKEFGSDVFLDLLEKISTGKPNVLQYIIFVSVEYFSQLSDHF